jgi:hypothetical protein
VPKHHRRELILGGLAAIALAPPARSAGYPRTLAFAAYRNGSRVGEQQMTFETEGDALTVRTNAVFAIKIGPVVLFRYHHSALERWRGGRFDRLETETQSGGKRETVVATHTTQGVVITAGTAKPVIAAAGTLPFTHWNQAIARAPLFNPQTGAVLHQTARVLGPSPVILDNGARLQAERVSFAGDASIDDWYDADGVWAALRGKLVDGSTLEYRRL